MQAPEARIDWFERAVAAVYSTIAVLGVAIVVLTAVLYLPGVNRGSLPLP
jgi:hypothetical protein